MFGTGPLGDGEVQNSALQQNGAEIGAFLGFDLVSDPIDKVQAAILYMSVEQACLNVCMKISDRLLVWTSGNRDAVSFCREYLCSIAYS